MTKQAKIGMVFEVYYDGDEQKFICPVCGSHNDTNYDLEDLQYCDVCSSEFRAFNAVELVKKGKTQSHVPLQQFWKLVK